MLLMLGGMMTLAGCQYGRAPIARDAADEALFGPVKMRIHPIFTRIKDWNGDNIPDGIEAELEFQDQFDDPCRAAGTVIFTLYSYIERDPDHRGDRALNPWVASLETAEAQRLRWDRTSRTYKFQLHAPGISLRHSYLLEAEYEHPGGRRLFARWIYKAPLQNITGPQPEIPPPATGESPQSTQPTTTPAGPRKSRPSATQPARHHGAAVH